MIFAPLLAGCAAVATLTQDHTLASKVQAALVADPRLKGSRIEVESRSGQITLTGTVPTFRERYRAIETALRVQGVRGVASKLELQSP